MANFTGAKCEYCKKIFQDSDDIVVCPECGTPYHRDCYNEAGECVNYELHQRGEDWEKFHNDRVEFSENAQNADNTSENVETEAVKCPRCGEENPEDGLFCKKCGLPLTKNQEARPFNDMGNSQNPFPNQQGMPFGTFNGMPPFQAQSVNLMEEEIDGHKGKKYVKFLKKNPVYYIVNFFNMSRKKSKMSFNISAFLFPEYYFFYRKMFGIGALMLILATILEIPSMIIYFLNGAISGINLPSFFVNNAQTFQTLEYVCTFIRLIIEIICGCFGNYFYFKKAKTTIEEVENMDISDEEKNELISQKGGTSGLALAFSITVNVALVMLSLIVLIMMFK